MSRTTNKPTNTEALDQVEAAVVRIMMLISAVLRKYPQETVAPAMLPFIQRHSDHAIRPSRPPRNGGGISDPRKEDEIVLVTTSFFSSKNTTLRFPLSLLDAPEQQITRWARDQYWAAVNARKHEARLQARVKADNAGKALKKAQRDHDMALKELATLTTVTASGTKKKRQS